MNFRIVITFKCIYNVVNSYWFREFRTIYVDTYELNMNKDDGQKINEALLCIIV